MNSFIRFFIVFVISYILLIAINATFATNLTTYAITSCNPEPHAFCPIFDIAYKWYWLAAPMLAALLSLVITLATKRNAA